MSVLDLSHVGVDLGGRPIVRDVSVRIEAGEVVAVLGPNGSGKSTLVKTIVRLNPLTRGAISLWDEPIGRFAGWQRIGYVPQSAPIAAGVPASVREVVASGRAARRTPLRPMTRQDKAAVHDAIAAVGLEERSGTSVGTLSGGQRQRVLVARALAASPDLLILDEPNAGVDRASQAAIADTLGRLAAAGGTVVVVLHELGPFAPLIDRTLVLHEGRVSFDGPPDRLAGSGETHVHHVGEPGGTWASVNAPLEDR